MQVKLKGEPQKGGRSQVAGMLLVAVAAVLLPLSPLQAVEIFECSPYTGEANLNEIVLQGTGQLEVKFVETKILTALGADLIRYPNAQWQLCMSKTTAPQSHPCNNATLAYSDSNVDCYHYGIREFTYNWDPDAVVCDDEVDPFTANDYLNKELNFSGNQFEAIILDGPYDAPDTKAIDYIRVCKNGCQESKLLWSTTGELPDGGGTSTSTAQCGNELTYGSSTGTEPIIFARLTDGTGEWLGSINPDGTVNPDGPTEPTQGEPNEEEPPPPPLDHLAIYHDGQALTCMAEEVTIRACSNADCSELYTGAVTVDFTLPISGWNPDPVTFSGGQADVQLRHTIAETVTLTAQATAPAATNQTQCVNAGIGAPCVLTFAEVGILIDGDDGDAVPESDIPTQIAGKPSDEGFKAATQRVRVVRTDSQTGACIAGVGNQTLDVELSYLVPAPVEGLSDNTVRINGASTAHLTAAGSVETGQLTFDGNGTAPFSFTSLDGGRYQIRVAMGIPVTDAGGTPTGELISASAVCNAFVVRPLAVFTDATGSPKAQDANGSPYKKAGEPFTLTFKSLRWASGRDNDSDGNWDLCSGSDLSDPASDYARMPAWTIGQADADLKLPSPGANPGLSYGDGDAVFAASASSTTADNVSYGEVGIIQLKPDDLNTFLGESVEVCSPYIGRFIPDHFETAVAHGSLADSCSLFTYTGQPFFYGTPPEITISAMNAAGNPVSNYIDNFNMLVASNVQIDYPTQDLTQAGADGSTPMVLTSLKDTATLTNAAPMVYTFGDDSFEYTRTQPVDTDNARIEPFTAALELTLTDINDSDGVAASGLPQAISPADIEIRYGLAQAENSFGPETEPQKMRVSALYFDGTDWVANEEDDCTQFGYTKSENGTIAVDVTPTTPVPLVNGQAQLTLTPTSDPGDPGGTVNFLLDFDDWLEPDPSATATFGIYRGNDRIVNWREVMR